MRDPAHEDRLAALLAASTVTLEPAEVTFAVHVAHALSIGSGVGRTRRTAVSGPAILARATLDPARASSFRFRRFPRPNGDPCPTGDPPPEGSRSSAGVPGAHRLSYHLLPSCGRVASLVYAMPNIKQQEKRVRQASRQRLENLRWRSTAKTLMRRLKEAADGGDSAAVGERHRELVSWLDKAASHGALHRNTAARRKAQAERIASGKPSS